MAKAKSFKSLGFSKIARAFVNKRTGAIHVKANSGAVSDLSWNNNTLAVTFARDGKTYHYAGVSKAQYDAILSAPSIGAYLNAHIIPHH